MSLYLWRYIFFCLTIFGLFKGFNVLVSAFSNSNVPSKNTDLGIVDPLSTPVVLDLIVVSTLDGLLHGVSRFTGKVIWTWDSASEILAKTSKPVSSTPPQNGYRFVKPSGNKELVRLEDIPAKDKVIYVPELLGEGGIYKLDQATSSLEKLPYTIKELVDKSPLRSGEVIYMGSKSTKYYAIDPRTGLLLQTFGDNSSGESGEVSTSSSGVLFLGKAEYKLAIYNEVKGKYEANITYSEFIGDAFEQPESLSAINQAHLSTGFLPTDPVTNQDSYAHLFNSPIISKFDILDLNRRYIASKQPLITSPKDEPNKRYVVEFNDTVLVFPREGSFASKQQLGGSPKVLEIECPNITEEPISFRAKLWDYTKRRGPFMGLIIIILYLLWHFKLMTLQTWYYCKEILMQVGHYLQDKLDEMYTVVFSKTGYARVAKQDNNGKEQTTGDNVNTPSTPKSKKKKKGGKSNKNLQISPAVEQVKPTPPVVEKIKGSLQLNSLNVSDTILGYGSHGTIVYKGSFDGRDVAVKRLLIDFYDVADHEVKLLRESDDHPNVIRYYCKEQCDRFMYIAVELCQASLFDSIEKGQLSDAASLIASVPPSKILYQIISGIHYLHSLKIIHRDIKPQNILISTPKQLYDKTNPPQILISDFGLCKKLEGEQSSFNNTTNSPAGTIGWRAPECLSSDVITSLDFDESETSTSSLHLDSTLPPRPTRITRAIDIFSAGCVFYYVLSGGEHPFGDRFVREGNILRGKYSLNKIDEMVEEGIEAKDLIGRMIAMNPRHRPSAYAIMLHPYFWTPAKRLAFLQDVSDRFEVEERDPPSLLLQALEDNAENVVGDDWYGRIDRVLIDNLGRYRRYDGYRIQDLLRAMRNKKHHYQDLPDHVKRSLGPLPHGFLGYFTSRFPNLFLHVYYTIADNPGLRQEHVFQPYFLAPSEL
ncbi:bifunctional endoribonuclease/protein kinase ire1 [Basidiobolus ranarum]|uniref:non-specific serine/threonine protein kinase n=1 Tax=Basidiobolus ranarum TaxID=34480 RepID=A0ABR2W4A2_9FUNG